MPATTPIVMVGTTAQRLASSKILGQGDLFLDTDTGRYGFGDGVTAAKLLNHMKNRYDGGEAFWAKNDSQYGTAVAYIAGDSSGVSPNSPSTGRWPKRWASRLAALYPNAGVKLFDKWDETNKVYADTVTVQAGATPPSGVVVKDTFTRTAADLKGTNADTGQTWTGASGTHGDFAVNGSAAVRTSQALTGDYIINSAAQGDRTVTAVIASMATTPQSPTVTYRLYTKYLDSGGQNYIMLSLNITNAAVSWSLFKRIGGVLTSIATGSINPVAFNQSSVGPFTITLQVSGTNVTGTINGVNLAATISSAEAATLAPATMDGFYNGVTGMTIDDFQVSVVPTSPVHQIVIYNGSVTGSMLATQQAELALQCPVVPDLALANSCHNYGSNGVAAYWALLDQFFNNVTALWPTTGLAIMSQDPQKSPALGVALHMLRNQSIRPYARQKGIEYIPVLEAWRALPDQGVSLIRDDGVHPTDNTDVADASSGSPASNGAQLWERVVNDWAKTKILAAAHLT